MDMRCAKAAYFDPGPKCSCLAPIPSLAQHRVLELGLKGFDLALTAVSNSERLVNGVLHFNRRLSGLKLRHKNIRGVVWPYLESPAGGYGAKGFQVVRNKYKDHKDSVILLHGFGADKDRMGGLGPFLRRYFHVVIPDLPGFGDHAPDWSGSYGVKDQVRRFSRFVEAMDLGRFHLFGISLGGYIAAYYTALHPHRVKSLCLMDSVGFSASVCSDALRLLKCEGRNLFLPGTGKEMQDMVDYLMHRPFRLPPAIRAYWVQQVREQLEWRKKMLDDLFDSGLELMDGLAPSIKAPTLVVWGGEDRISHVSTVGRILELIDNSRAYIIRGCGHIPFLEFPSLSQKIYMDFLRQVGE